MSSPDPIYAWARGVVRDAWKKQTGNEATLFQAQCVQALTKYETSWGQSWTGAGVGSHNWGSVQATKAQVDAGVPVFTYTDHLPDNTPYQQAFRKYDSDVDGCADVIKYMRGAAGGELDAGRSTDDVWAALFYGHYYGARCPNALRQYGQAAVHSFGFTGVRADTPAGKACEAECIKQGQDAGAAEIADIASHMGEQPSPRGSFPWLLAVVPAGLVAYFFRDKLRLLVKP